MGGGGGREEIRGDRARDNKGEERDSALSLSGLCGAFPVAGFDLCVCV